MIFFIIYLVLASTVGAYLFAVDRADGKEDVTLFDVLGCIAPSIVLSWIFFIIWIGDKIILKKKS